MDYGKLLFTFEGRIGRQSFWVGWAILFVAGLLLSFIPLLNLLGFLLIYPKVCIYAKRLHDMGKSGWFQVIPYAVWVVASIAGIAMFGAGIMTAVMQSQNARENPEAFFAILQAMGGFFGVMMLAWLTSIAFLVWVGATPSQPGANQYDTDQSLTTDVF